jgi:hypothetical protein
MRSGKISEKSRFDEESAAGNLQRKKHPECTQVPLRRPTFNTDLAPWGAEAKRKRETGKIMESGAEVQ